MIWLILATLVAALIVYGMVKDLFYWDIDDIVIAIIFFLLFSALGWVLVVAIMTATATDSIEPTVSESSYKLESINSADYANTSGYVHGGAFYVHGAINTSGDTSYKVYRKISDTEFKLEHIPSSNSMIVYDNGTPMVESTSYHCEQKYKIHLFYAEHCEEPETQYRIYVPEGSIINEINL